MRAMHKRSALPVGVVGASGYTGLELTRILAAHPGVAVAFLASDRWDGDTAGKRAGVEGPAGELRYVGLEQAPELARGCAAVLLATPAEASHDLAPKLLERGVKVVDLSGAFRLREGALYPTHYGFEHRHPQLYASAAYGLTERSRGQVARAKLVANPGCFPTAVSLALLPLLDAGLISTERLIVDAASGVSGAGRKASEDYSFCELEGDFRAYKVLKHQHTPEIAQTLGAPLTFVTHLLPIKRGILATCHAQLKPGVAAGDVAAAFQRAYANEPFVKVASSADDVSLKQVVGTNRCLVGFTAVGSELVITSAIDNLVKGAAGQAVQNLNLLLGLEETSGLQGLRAFHP